MIGKWMQRAVLALVAGSAMSLGAAPRDGLEKRGGVQSRRGFGTAGRRP